MKIVIILALIVFIPIIVSKFLNLIISIIYRHQQLIPFVTGEQARDVIETFLYKNNLTIPIRISQGSLTDSYDPHKNILYLSETTYYSNSVAAYAIGLHEVGHALQVRDHYMPQEIRIVLHPISILILLITFIAAVFSLTGNTIAITITIIFLSTYIIIQLSTIKAEINASQRALDMLVTIEGITGNDLENCKHVLKLAYWTYIIQSIANLSVIFFLLAAAGNKKQ